MTDIRYRPSDYRLLPKSNLDRMERNNPYITKIYDYEDWLLPHPDREGFDRKWQRKVQNSSKAHVEIGCGSGRYLMEMARNKPEDTFLGLELRLKRLVLAAKKIKREQLENILLMRERGEYLDDYFETGSIDVLHINFPDPWSKKCRRKHRIFSEAFLEMMFRLFSPKGEIFFKTDHLEYFKSTSELLYNSQLFEIKDFTYDLHQSEFSDQNIKTEFELLFHSKGNPPIGFLRARRIPN